MVQITKRQHYVWRRYLKAWSDNEKIWTYFKELNKIIKTSLMNVAQEKYFYKLEEITDEDKEILAGFISRYKLQEIKEMNLLMLELFSLLYKIQLEGSDKIDFEKIKEFYSVQELNLLENLHGQIERFGFRILECKDVDDLIHYSKNADFYELIFFLNYQYFRTKNMEVSINSDIGFEIDEKTQKIFNTIRKHWNIVSMISANNATGSMLADPRMSFVFIENPTKTKFITSDQPGINLLSDNLDDDGCPKELELYYPLSPTTAIIVNFDEKQKDYIIKKVIDEDYVNYLNKSIIDKANFFVFADNELSLKLI